MRKTKSHWEKSVQCKRFVLWVKHMKCVCFYNPNTILHSLVFQAYICHVAQRCGNIVTSHQNLQFYDVYNQKPTSTTNDDQIFMTVVCIFSYHNDAERNLKLSGTRWFCISPTLLGNIAQPIETRLFNFTNRVSCLLRSQPGSRRTRMGLFNILTSVYLQHF